VVVAYDRMEPDHSSLLGQEWPRLWATPYSREILKDGLRHFKILKLLMLSKVFKRL
jgi:hypothetical protein